MNPTVVFPLNDSVGCAGKIVGMIPRMNPTRRWLACCSLAIAWGMANWGGMVLHTVLAGWLFIAWWALCVAFALFSVILASVEVLFSWRGLREAQRRCRRDQRRELDHLPQDQKTDD